MSVALADCVRSNRGCHHLRGSDCYFQGNNRSIMDNGRVYARAIECASLKPSETNPLTSSHRLKASLERLAARKPVFGCIQALPATQCTEMAILAGFDFVMLDCEHSVVDEAAHLASLQIIGASPAFSAVRVRPKDYHAVGHYLDLGADVILMPNVRTRAEAERFCAAGRIGPDGARSFNGGATRAQRYGLGSDAPAPTPLLMAMIESVEGVENAAVIAETPGLGGLAIGPNDLAADLGVPDNFASPRFAAAVREVERVAAEHDLPLSGAAYTGLSSVDQLAAAHYTLIVVANDIAALRAGFVSALARIGPDAKERI